MSSPILLRYAGEGVFEPANPYFARKADAAFVIGQQYSLVEHRERSSAAHNRFFAAVAEAWKTLPDALLDEYGSPETLRKKMLIRCGYSDERSIACASKAEAQRVAAFIKPMDAHAVVIVRDAVVRVYTAQSQSYRAMGKKVFYESADRVLDAIAKLLGVTPAESEPGGGSMSRREFPKKIMGQAALRANGQCEKCSARLASGGFHYDHVIPDALGGEPTLENCAVLCKACHGEKTSKEDVPRISKTERIRLKHAGAWRSLHPMRRRPSPPESAQR